MPEAERVCAKVLSAFGCKYTARGGMVVLKLMGIRWNGRKAGDYRSCVNYLPRGTKKKNDRIIFTFIKSLHFQSF